MSFSKKFLATLIIVLSAAIGSIGYFNSQNLEQSQAKDQSEVLGVTQIDNPKTDDSSINSFIPDDIDPPELVFPTPGDFETDNSLSAFAASDNSSTTIGSRNNNQQDTPVETEEETTENEEIEDIHDLLEEQVEIAYDPGGITQVSERNPEALKFFTPEEITVADSNPGQVVGFTDSTINHNSQNVPVNQPFTVTLPDNYNQKLIENLQFYPKAEFQRSLVGNQLTITPINQQRDTQYIFGLQNNPICFTNIQSCNVVPKENWSFGLGFSTAVWQNTVYGKSVQNRDLAGTILGKCRSNNCIKIMLTGGLHGSEWRSGDLTQLIEYIKNNPAEISGQDKEFYIIPFTNPDGTFLNDRYNARAVNLNRNFPANWESCPQCGSGPNSEPEAQALHDLTWNWRPNYLISYHAQWPPNGIIFRGDDNDQNIRNFAIWVADRTGYPIGEFPGFDTVPGDQTVWAAGQGIQSIIIEASLVENSDWNKNFNMYLALLREV